MADFLMAHYMWIKAFHIIAVISWMAGLLYLPRLYVYHADAKKGSPLSETFKIMEMRLLRYIMNPAMIVVWILGLAMIAVFPDVMQQGWIHAKLTLVLLLSGMHGMMAKWRKDFANDRNARPAKFFRIMNEIPTVLMIAIVILAVVKPF